MQSVIPDGRRDIGCGGVPLVQSNDAATHTGSLRSCFQGRTASLSFPWAVESFTAEVSGHGHADSGGAPIRHARLPR